MRISDWSSDVCSSDLFALDWCRPPRQMNGTSYYYFNTDQWRYEKVKVEELLSPLADPRKYSGSIADLNLRAVRMGWLPCAPQLDRNPLQVARDAARSGQSAADYVVDGLKSGNRKSTWFELQSLMRISYAVLC